MDKTTLTIEDFRAQLTNLTARLDNTHEANRKRITALENQLVQLMSLAEELQGEITDMKLSAEDV